MRDDDMVKIGSLFDLFGCSDEDLYAKGTIEDALYDGTLTVIDANCWIRVEDELPKEYGNYLAVVNGEVMEVTFSPVNNNPNVWSTCNADGFEWLPLWYITHWMPLPDAPEVER